MVPTPIEFQKTLTETGDVFIAQVSVSGQLDLKLSEADVMGIDLLKNIGESLDLDLEGIGRFDCERTERDIDIGTNQIVCEQKHMVSGQSPLKKARIKLVDHLADTALAPLERRHEYALELAVNPLVSAADQTGAEGSGYRKGVLNFRFTTVEELKALQLRVFFAKGYATFRTCKDYSKKARINSDSKEPADKL